jgi:long-chain fatty acid transport protein
MTTLFPFRHTRIAAAIGSLGLSLAAGQALGAGFALSEQNASGLGHAYAGGAAAAEDVSTIYFNPAGLVRLATAQVVVAGNLICPSAKFNDGGSLNAFGQPLGGNGGDAGSCAVVPAMYVGVPFTDKWSFGLGINAPFGLKTEYNNDWLGRFQNIKSKVETLNINPVLSWEPTKNLTVGAGASWQKVKAQLTKDFNYAAGFAQGVQGLVASGQLPPQFANTLIGSAAGLSSFVDANADDTAWGWNVGILWQASDQTRFGAAYRSTIKYTAHGTVSFNNPTAANLGPLPPALAPAGAGIVNGLNAQLANGNISVAIKLPDTANVSIFHQFDSKWDVMADLQYTGWSSFHQLQLVRDTGVVLSTIPENWRNTWRVSVGTNYRYDDKWTFRSGLAYDQSPVNNTDRNAAIPDNDRTWLAFGAQYKFDPNWAFDLAYAYIWVKDPSINQNGGSTAQNGLISGSYKNNVQILGAQVTYTFK